jgi:hypothetical protein
MICLHNYAVLPTTLHGNGVHLLWVFEVSTRLFGTYECVKCPPVSWVHTNVRSVHQFLGYIRMFEVSTSFLSTYECSKCPPVFWVHTNVRSVHQFLGYILMFEVSTSFLGTYECPSVSWYTHNRTNNWSDISASLIVKLWRSLSVVATWHSYTIYFVINSIGKESLCTSKLEVVTCSWDQFCNSNARCWCITFQNLTVFIWHLGMEVTLGVSSWSIYIKSRNTHCDPNLSLGPHLSLCSGAGRCHPSDKQTSSRRHQLSFHHVTARISLCACSL